VPTPEMNPSTSPLDGSPGGDGQRAADRAEPAPAATSRPGPDRAGPSRIRIGVDVGGTFTKAVAFDLAAGRAVATASVPTTHGDPRGPAAGVVHVIADVARAVGPERVDLVTHSTTQAVNALLEGDGAKVGVIGLAQGADLRRARKRTTLQAVELSPGRPLAAVSEVLDVTAGLDEVALDAVLDRLAGAGAEAVCVAEAFAPDDDRRERRWSPGPAPGASRPVARPISPGSTGSS
jgi:N-methylhydantoinase A